MTIERSNMERRYIRLDMPELKKNFIFFDPEKISKVKLGCYNVGGKPTPKGGPEYYDCIEMKVDGEKERFLFANKVNDNGRYLEEKDAEQVLMRVMEVIENIVEFRNTSPYEQFQLWPDGQNIPANPITGSAGNDLTPKITWTDPTGVTRSEGVKSFIVDIINDEETGNDR